MIYTNVIKQWFKDEFGGSLLLPDGWYGRPYDNKHLLTSVEEGDEILTVVLDQKLTLRFKGLRSVTVQNRELVFGTFENLSFHWQSFGAEGEHGIKEYQDGEVRIFAGAS